jgi:hypothetical protein
MKKITTEIRRNDKRGLGRTTRDFCIAILPVGGMKTTGKLYGGPSPAEL